MFIQLLKQASELHQEWVASSTEERNRLQPQRQALFQQTLQAFLTVDETHGRNGCYRLTGGEIRIEPHNTSIERLCNWLGAHPEIKL